MKPIVSNMLWPENMFIGVDLKSYLGNTIKDASQLIYVSVKCPLVDHKYIIYICIKPTVILNEFFKNS